MTSNIKKYTGIDLFSQVISNQVSSTLISLTSVFGMETGETLSPLTPAATQQLFVGDPYETRTRVAAVRGRSLNRLTNGPIWCTIGDSNPGPTD